VDFGTMLEEAGVSAVTVHGRTRQQLYSGKADWSFIALVKKALSIPVFGNGDVFEAEDAVRLLEATNCDGVAVARGTLGNPWLIPRITKLLDTGVCDEPPDDIERLIAGYRHAVGLIAYKGQRVGANESRRHLTHYTKGILHSAPFRNRLTQINTAAEAAVILAELALQVGGKEGLARFLLDVENINLHYGKQVSKWHSDSGSNFPTPVVLNTVLPVAKPNYATPEGNTYPAK
jgi:tRNA-dihydrouridine synthase